MKKRNLCLGSILTVFGVLALIATNVNTSFKVVSAESGCSSTAWMKNGTTANIDVTGDNTDFTISNLHQWGDRVRNINGYTLDGLQFDYYLYGIDSTGGCNYHRTGFYFSYGSSDELYFKEATAANNFGVFTFMDTYAASASQIRFGVQDSYVLNCIDGGGMDRVVFYSDKGNTKYHGAGKDGSVVMNHREDKDKSLGIHFKFQKDGDTYYKMTMTEITHSLIWKDNTNYTTDGSFGSVTCYINKSYFGLYNEGKTNLMLYSMDAGSASSVEAHIKNITDSVTYTVTFDSQGGSTIAPVTVERNCSVARPTPNPTKQNCVFDDWYTEAACQKKWNFANAITENKTLYAGWKNAYSITFYANTGTGTMNPETKIQGVDYTIPACSFQKTGNQFTSWNTQADGKGTSYAVGNAYKTDANLQLFAQWATQTYTVTFHTVYGTAPSAQNIAAGNKAVKPDDPTATGYSFIGWYDNESFSGNQFDFNTPINDNLDLYGKWKDAEYTIVFKDENVVISSATYTFDQDIVMPSDPTKAGKTFTGWFENPSDNKAYPISGAKAQKDLTLYAGWQTAKVSVQYIANKQVIDTVTVDVGTYLTKPNDPTIDHMIFKGWFTDVAFTKPFDFALDCVENSLNLYAKFEYSKVNIRFEINGGTSVAKKVDYGTVVDPTQLNLTTTVEGYNFVGWYDDANFLTIHDWVKEITADLIVYGKYEVKQCLVSFIKDDNKICSDVAVNYGSKVEKPANINWYTDKECTKQFDFNTEIKEDIKLYTNQDIPVSSGCVGTVSASLTMIALLSAAGMVLVSKKKRA